MSNSKVPILFIIFNRPDIARSSFDAIRQYQPTDLYISADGPRESRDGEDILCEETRKTILDMIDWECNIHTLFREKNIGVDFGVYSAINWMFETEKWGIIIEDDCYVSQDFFLLCEDAFPRYNDNPKIAHIIANNPMTKLKESSKIEFTYHAMTWGWGTWRDKWNRIMDVEMKGYNDFSIIDFINRFGVFQGSLYKRAYRNAYRNRHLLKTWDTIWTFGIIYSKSLCLLPMVNLAINKGIGTCEGSHYQAGETDFYEGLKIGRLVAPYKYPEKDNILKYISKMERRHYFKLRMFGLKKKLNRLIKLRQ